MTLRDTSSAATSATVTTRKRELLVRTFKTATSGSMSLCEMMSASRFDLRIERSVVREACLIYV
jgi:hypothetical protein